MFHGDMREHNLKLMQGQEWMRWRAPKVLRAVDMIWVKPNDQAPEYTGLYGYIIASRPSDNSVAVYCPVLLTKGISFTISCENLMRLDSPERDYKYAVTEQYVAFQHNQIDRNEYLDRIHKIETAGKAEVPVPKMSPKDLIVQMVSMVQQAREGVAVATDYQELEEALELANYLQDAIIALGHELDDRLAELE